MGDWLIWLLVGSLVVILFCIYSLSSQVERCVHLAVEIITGNQRKILDQLELLNRDARAVSRDDDSTADRRIRERRLSYQVQGNSGERRHSPGRRRQDRVVNLRGG